MPPILDFSSAFPWLGAGFLAGLLVFWLIRALTGIDRRRKADLLAATGELDVARRAHATLSQSYAQVDAERARLVNDTAQLSQRVSLIPQLERQIADLRQADAARASALEAATTQLSALRETSGSELTALREEAEQAIGTAKYYEAEFGRLFEAHQALSKDAGAASQLVTKLQSDYTVASREAHEAARLRSELASAKAQNESLIADVQEHKASVQRYQEDITRLRREHEQALVAVETAKSSGSSSADEINRLKTELAAAQKRGESADEVLRLNAEIARLKPIETEHAAFAGEVTRLKSALSAALSAAPDEDLKAEVSLLNEEVERLRAALSAASSEDHGVEVSRLRDELANLRFAAGESENLASEVTRLKAAASAEAASHAEELERIKSEASKLNAALASARADERSAAMELHATKNDLQQARIAMEETSRLVAERHAEIDQLKARLAGVPADLENYRRFKDALDAANRIAQGLPEKP